MTATLTWLDYSSEERRRAIEVIKLFEQHGTVDELGIGTVRDALSDILFPGTSTLHTRARYFLFIPWGYLDLERRRVSAAEFAKRGRKLELQLINGLLESDDSAGTIGRIAGDKLKILPSTMYWSGLERWGIRRFRGHQEAYRRTIERWYRLVDGEHRNDDGDIYSPAPLNWDPALPSAPDGFPKCPLTMQLEPVEAEYLRERLLAFCSGTLLAFLVDQCEPVEESRFIWEHPDLARFPEENTRQVEHARIFSEGIHGAALLYNLLLAEGLHQEEWREEYEDRIASWIDLMEESLSRLRAWDREAFWKLVKSQGGAIPIPTQNFADRWFDLLLAHRPAEIPGLNKARHLISERERFMKGKLARLHNREALNHWNGTSGSNQLTYRWNPQVQQLTRDIQLGLRSHA